MDNIALIEPESDPRWDRFVEHHPHGWLCHLSGWKQVLEKSFGHMRGYYPALIDETGAIKAALPVFAVRSILRGNRLVSIPHATLCDPLVETTDQLEMLLQKVFDLAKSIRIKNLQIRALNCGLLSSDDRFWNNSFFKHHYLLLDKEPEKLKQSFDRTNIRQRIQRAINSGIVVKKAEQESEMVDYYKLHVMTRQKLGLPPQPYRFFKNLWDTFSPSQQIVLLLAKRDDQILSGLILFKFKNRVSAEFLGHDETYLNLSPNHLLFWEAIQSAYNEGYKIFDLGRTSPTSESLMKFKKRWGTCVMDLPRYYYPKKAYEGYIEPEQTFAFKVISKTAKKLPETACRLLGEFLYRHLG